MAILMTALTSACAPSEDEETKLDLEQSAEASKHLQGTLGLDPDAGAKPNMTIVDTTGAIVALGASSVTAVCPTGSILTGGGFRNSNALLMIGSTTASGSTSWQSTAFNGLGVSLSLLSEALCLRNVVASAQTVEASATIPAQSSVCVAAACPANTKLTGGGFFETTVGPRVYASLPLTNQSWRVCTRNESNSTGTLLAHARCLSLPAGATITRIVTGAVSVGPGGTGNAYAYCPSNSKVVGGGFSIPYTDWTVMRSESYGDYFRVEARNNTTGTNTFQALANCLQVP